MPSKSEQQYTTDRNLRARSNLIAKYSNKNWFEWVHQTLSLQAGSSVLDVGCGMGWFWCDASAANAPLGRLALVDSLPALLAQANDNLAPLSFIEKLDAHECDVISLPMQDQSFDAVLAMHMLYHVADQKAAVSQLARVVRHNGKVAITTNSLENSKSLMRLAQTAFGGSGRDPGAELFSPEMGITLLSHHFSHVETHEFTDTLIITDAEDIYAALVSMPPGNEVTDAEKTKLLELLQDLAISDKNPIIDNRSSFLLIAGHRD